MTSRSRPEDMDEKASPSLRRLRREVGFLKIYCVGLTAFLGLAIAGGASSARKHLKFEEIDVERLNVVEADGTLRMALHAQGRCPDGVVDGKILKGRAQGATPGIIFYNEAGECGGLTFDGALKEGKAAAGMPLTFDQFRQDQTIGLQYDDESGRRQAALKVWDRSEVPYSELADRFPAAFTDGDSPEKVEALRQLASAAPASLRLMVGKDRDRSAVVRLADAAGRVRINIAVDAGGTPRMEFLDEGGKVMYRLPPG